MNGKIGIITQARLGSERLNRKILLEAGGKSMLRHHLERLLQSGLPVYLATTREKGIEPVLATARELGVPYYQGDLRDVLGRFYHCARQFKLETVVRATSDPPLLDGVLLPASD